MNFKKRKSASTVFDSGFIAVQPSVTGDVSLMGIIPEITYWDGPIGISTYPKIGGGFYIYFTINPDEKWWSAWSGIPMYYSLEVFCKSYGVKDNNVGIVNSTDKFLINIKKRLIGTLGESIGYSIDDNEDIYVNCKICSSHDEWMYYCYKGVKAEDIFNTPSDVQIRNGIVTFNCDSRTSVTACEFKSSITPSPFEGYSDSVRALFYETACQETEIAYEGKFYNKKFKRWENKEVTVGINFMSSVKSPSLQRDFKSYVVQACSTINKIVSGSGLLLKTVDGLTNGTIADIDEGNGIGEIKVWWGDYKELWDENVPESGFRYFGQWENNEHNNRLEYITEGLVTLCTEKVWMMNFQGIAFEEIAECLGAGNDVFHIANSVYSDFWFPNKNLNSSLELEPYDCDRQVLELLYNYNLPSNTDNWIIAQIINAPNGARAFDNAESHVSSGSVDLSFLNGSAYKIRLVSAEIFGTSAYTEWIDFSSESSRPENWYWTTDIRQGARTLFRRSNVYMPITATEWNSLCSRINEFREYKGLVRYNFTHVSSGTRITAGLYNEAVYAINEINDNNKTSIPQASDVTNNGRNTIMVQTVGREYVGTDAEMYLVLNRNLNLIE